MFTSIINTYSQFSILGYKIICILIVTSICSNGLVSGVSRWAVEVDGGIEEANEMAKQAGCHNLGLIHRSNSIYIFQKDSKFNQSSYNELNTKHEHYVKRSLESHPKVKWYEPQYPLQRTKRDLLTRLSHSLSSGSKIPRISSNNNPADILTQRYPQMHPITASMKSHAKFSSPSMPRNLNDELWQSQWYLTNEGQEDGGPINHVSLNVEEVWQMGFTGKNVVVTIIDDGLEHNHTDIEKNYDRLASYDYNHNIPNPYPRYDKENTNSHGTRCAGEIAMTAHNRKCGAGVAPGCRIGGIKLLDGNIEDNTQHRALLHNIDYIDIYSNSWGPRDTGHELERPGKLTLMAIEEGVKEGRNGKGALYVWANGNGGRSGDNCACDWFINSIYTIAIGGSTQQGQFPFYGERCSATLAVTACSGSNQERGIVTTDLHNRCTANFEGTSASAPLAAGIYALALEANPNITWRDAQHLTVWTSNPYPLRNNQGWKKNGAGLIFNNRFGFGLMDAKAMVSAALTWETAPMKATCVVRPITNLPVYMNSGSPIRTIFRTDGCQSHMKQVQHTMIHHSLEHRPQAVPGVIGKKESERQINPVIFLEHVQVIVDIEYTERGRLDMFLVSPSGTVSTLLMRRPLDKSRHGFRRWNLTSVHFWSEVSVGEWHLLVRDKETSQNRGVLNNATLILHGTAQLPSSMTNPRIYQEGNQIINQILDPISEMDQKDPFKLKPIEDDLF